ncbi:MAG: polyprenol monophosphomannose synthase [Candidatus Woesearchaeota archaeon]
MNKKISIVIPVHNEEKNIPLLVDKILNLKKELTIIIIDDNSTDNSWKILKKISLNNKKIKIYHRDKQEGLHAVLIDGLKRAMDLGFDGAITMDGDLSHPPSAIPEILNYIDKYDIVVGSRFVSKGKTTNWNLKKKTLSFIARNTSRLLLGIKTKDCSSGFKYYDKKIINSFNFNKFATTGYAFQIETILRAERNNFKIKEIPITFKGRMYGESKVDFNEIKRYFKSVLSLLKIKINN